MERESVGGEHSVPTLGGEQAFFGCDQTVRVSTSKTRTSTRAASFTSAEGCTELTLIIILKGAGSLSLTSSMKGDSADVGDSSALLSAEKCASGVVPPALKAADKSLLEASDIILCVLDLLLLVLVTDSVEDDSEFSIPIDTRSNSAIVVIDRAPSFDDESVPLARILQELRETLNSVAKRPGSTLHHILKPTTRDKIRIHAKRSD